MGLVLFGLVDLGFMLFVGVFIGVGFLGGL